MESTETPPRDARKIGWQSFGIIVSVGFFALAAQTLLFRIFLTVFEGNELGIACFFSSWLMWVVAGAICGRSRRPLLNILGDRFEFLPLLYLPACLLQWWLISHARELAGVRPYELFPLLTMLSVTFLANAPVSFCTGALFTLACRWVRPTDGWVRPTASLPVAKVYIWESVGSVLGGLTVTLLLARGMAEETLFLYTALLLTVMLAIYRLQQRSYVTAALPVLAVAAVLCAGVAGRWEQRNNLHTWQRVLATQTPRGSFTTPEAKYLYGEYGEQFNVVAWETVADVIPATEHASEIVALHIAQRPAARRFLVAGRGAFSICRRLLALPQAEAITWFDPDPAYPAHLLGVLPERFMSGVERLEIPGDDIRRWLSRTRSQYDVIILNCPDATTLALNRYFTREFFQLLKAHLNANGVIGVRVSAGENFMSEDRVNVGASVFATLRSVFPYLVVKPGDESWLLVSASPGLITTPAALRDRFAAIPGADRLYPPSGLMALYLPQRITYEMQCYEAAVQSTPTNLLLNTDRSPKALLHSLLFAAHEAGGAASLGSVIRTFALHGIFILPMGLLLFPLLRFLFLLRRRSGVRVPPSVVCRLSSDARPPSSVVRRLSSVLRRLSSVLRRLFPVSALSNPRFRGASKSEGRIFHTGCEISGFDNYALVLTTGAAGMGSSIVLMYLFQSAFGSIFLHVGLISALFMLGLAAGSTLAAHLLADAAHRSSGLLGLTILIHVLFCGVILFLAGNLTHAEFAAAFVISGLLNGIYVPLAACRLNAAGVPPAEAGAWIEALDHFGGAAGGLVTGLVLLPVFGTAYGLLVLALLLAINVAAIWSPAPEQEVGGVIPDRFHEWTMSVGYVLFGVTLFMLAAGLLLKHGGAEEERQAFMAFAHAGAGKHELQARQQLLADGKTLEYFFTAATPQDTAPAGEKYIFRTDTLAPDIVGYGGPLTLAVMVAADGTLQDFAVLHSEETPAYLDYLRPWMQRLLGGKLFVPDPLKDIDAVTGATLTSSAILRILRKAGPAFAGKVLGLTVSPTTPDTRQPTPYKATLWLALALAAALALRAHPDARSAIGMRRGFLLLVLVLFGFVFNMQYSLDHVFSLLELTIPPFGWGTAFLLVVGIPVLVALFGNVYCGYLCPFGALQELVGDLRPASLRTDADKTAWAYGRFVKYLLFALMTILFATTLESALASSDPLVTVFAHERNRLLLCLVAVLTGLAFFYPRFWCRTLCPAGAFLSLLNGIRLLRWLAPPVAPRACIYGVRESRDLDCLCCDRCRQPGRQEQLALARPPDWVAARPINTVLLAAAGALALLLAVQTMAIWRNEIVGARTRGRSEMVGRGARSVDMKQLRYLIEQGRLSDREARFYKTAPSAPPHP